MDLLFRLYLHGRRIRQMVSTSHHEQMFTGTILWLIQKKDRTVSEMSELLSTTASTISEKLTQLERDGLIQRTTSTADKRAQLIQLTPYGNTALTKIITTAHTACMFPLNSLSPKETLQFETLLQRILPTD